MLSIMTKLRLIRCIGPLVFFCTKWYRSGCNFLVCLVNLSLTINAKAMTTPASSEAGQWSGWKKVLFRFFFIYFLLFINPIGMSPSLPLWEYVQDGYESMISSVVNLTDHYLLHIQPPPGVTVPVNDGAGDTTYFWAQLWIFVLLAAVGCLIWSLLDRRRKNYERLGYWLRTALRYYIALECFQYGIIKLFCLQMPAPNLSQLATPLGDFGAMRLCWMYMGYSKPFEVFAGMAEIVAGLLLLYRRTVTLGLLIALGVFINVMTMNLSYDIPVKGYSMELTLCCLVLLVWDHQRLFSFLALNRPAGDTRLYEPVDTGRGIRIARVVLKLYFVYFAIGRTFFADGNRSLQLRKAAEVTSPIHRGVYAVRVFAVNGDTIKPSFVDNIRWKDVIFDTRGRGSVNARDTSFALKYGYGRGLFHYETDSIAHLLTMTRSAADHYAILECHYEQPDNNTVLLRGRLHQDSLFVMLRRTDRQFQLSEWQFHWVSESNR